MSKYISFILLFMLFITISYADNNGIWHYAKDVRPGTFASDEVSGEFTFIDNLNIKSSTSQAGLSISGISDSGNTYSGIYLHDDTPDFENLWVLSHKNKAGTDDEGDFHIGRWNNPTNYSEFLKIDKDTGALSSKDNFRIVASNDELKFAGVRIKSATSDGAPGITFERDSDGPRFVSAIGIAKIDHQFSDDAVAGDMIIRGSQGGDIKISTMIGTTKNSRMTIKNNGYIGIGTNFPQSKLHIEDTGVGFKMGRNVGSVTLLDGVSSGSINGMLLEGGNNGNPLPAIIIKSHAPGGTGGIALKKADTTSGYLYNDNDDMIMASVFGDLVLLSKNGDVAIGDTGLNNNGKIMFNKPVNTFKMLDQGTIDSGGRLHITSRAGDNLYLNPWTGSGDVYVGGGGGAPNLVVSGDAYAKSFIYTSDERLKRNISYLNEENINKILDVKGYTYNWKDDGKADIGVIAQEVEEIYPELVYTKNDGMKAVDYTKLVVPLIELVKKQDDEINVLKEDIESLRTDIKKLKEK